MTPEERLAIAMRHPAPYEHGVDVVEDRYPYCCQWHEGFDAALALGKPEKVRTLKGWETWYSFEATP